MIEPTPGRVLWYRPTQSEVGEAGLTPDGNRPLAAHIAFVHGPELVNLMVIDASGVGHSRKSVPLVQDGEPPEGACAWMPFQKGQAGKVDESGPKIAALEQQVVALAERLANTTEGLDKRMQELADAQARKPPAPEAPNPVDPAPAPVVVDPKPVDPAADPAAAPQASVLDALAQPQG